MGICEKSIGERDREREGYLKDRDIGRRECDSVKAIIHQLLSIVVVFITESSIHIFTRISNAGDKSISFLYY